MFGQKLLCLFMPKSKVLLFRPEAPGVSVGIKEEFLHDITYPLTNVSILFDVLGKCYHTK